MWLKAAVTARKPWPPPTLAVAGVGSAALVAGFSLIAEWCLAPTVCHWELQVAGARCVHQWLLLSPSMRHQPWFAISFCFPVVSLCRALSRSTGAGCLGLGLLSYAALGALCAWGVSSSNNAHPLPFGRPLVGVVAQRLAAPLLVHESSPVAQPCCAEMLCEDLPVAVAV